MWFIDRIPIEFLEVLVYWHELSSFLGIFQKCLMVVPKETKSQSECVDWFRSNQVEIFNKGGIADIGPSFHAIELLSRELLQYLKSQKSPGFVFLLIYFDLLESNCRHIFLHKNQKIYHSEFFFSWYIFWSNVSYILL